MFQSVIRHPSFTLLSFLSLDTFYFNSNNNTSSFTFLGTQHKHSFSSFILQFKKFNFWCFTNGYPMTNLFNVGLTGSCLLDDLFTDLSVYYFIIRNKKVLFFLYIKRLQRLDRCYFYSCHILPYISYDEKHIFSSFYS